MNQKTLHQKNRAIDLPVNRPVNIDNFSQQILAMSARLSNLMTSGSSLTSSELLPEVLKELGVATETLQVAVEHLRRQNEELTIAVDTIAAERKRYQDLFQFAPQAYLITSLEGCVREANAMAAHLLGVSAQFLVGKPLMEYVCEGDRTSFQSELLRRQQRDYFQEWQLQLNTRNRECCDVACSTVAIRDAQGNPVAFRWTLRDITQNNRIAALERQGQDANPDAAILQDRPCYLYQRGDLILLKPQALWFVTQGLVKLTTLTEQNHEVLIGFVGPGMPFGAYLTALSLYQATALSEVRVVAIGLDEIAASAYLAKVLIAKASQRLRQTEALLAISGERRVENRLCQLLQLLKDEVGHPVSEGVRLTVRLTHEDLASACCTTRVTTTRLLGKLQQRSKISIDEKSHIILLDGF